MKNLTSILGSKWVKEILMLLSKEKEVRFLQIANSLGITTKVLSEKLNMLQSYGLIKRELREDRSTFYSLTKDGERLVELIKEIDKICKQGKISQNNASIR